MTSSANVRSIQALSELKASMQRFHADTEQALNSASLQIRRTLEWLAERQGYWRTEARKREEMVSRARAALRACEASGYEDNEGHYHAPYCGREEQALHLAQMRLQDAQAELRNVQSWTRAVKEAVADYQRQARRLASLIGNEVPKATALLDRKASTLRGYVTGVGPLISVASRKATAQPVRDYYVQGSLAETKKLASASEKLETTGVGKSIAEAMKEHGTMIKFGRTERKAIAQFAQKANVITINDSLKNGAPQVLAAHFAHEGTHVQWNSDHPSIQEEYHAFKSQDQVWAKVKGDQRDPQCDWVSGIIARGEARAKKAIRSLYPGYPEY